MKSKLYNKLDLDFLSSIKSDSVSLVLTDPPYAISKKTGMQKYKEHLEKGGEVNAKFGKQFARATDFGDWDKDYTTDHLKAAIDEFYRILKPGGSCIIWYDLWKLETLRNMLDRFSKHRMIEWIKTNPQPINQKATYLSNAREIAISCVKGNTATFNSIYDNGVYSFPLESKNRIHPTQKSFVLFQELILKHSNEKDIVVDPYSGSATTYVACVMNRRTCLSAEIDKTYYEKSLERISNAETKAAKLFKKEAPLRQLDKILNF